jgi:CBS domain-containing protein
MTIGKIGKRKVITVLIKTSIYEIAALMKNHNIGDVVVVEEEEKQYPLGIITDRDIAIRIVADAVNPNEVCAQDVMSYDLLILKEYQSVQEALDMMCAKQVRRASIVNVEGALVGMISIDDIVLLIADEMNSYAKLIRKQLFWANRS